MLYPLIKGTVVPLSKGTAVPLFKGTGFLQPPFLEGHVQALQCFNYAGSGSEPEMLHFCRVWERAGNASFLQGLGNGTLDA